jgi:DNA-binding IscR family transcriptional regulator
MLEVMTPTGTRLSLCVGKPSSCRRAGTCRMHRAIGSIQMSMDRQLRAVSLASLVD